jgi:hypothetical protein
MFAVVLSALVDVLRLEAMWTCIFARRLRSIKRRSISALKRMQETAAIELSYA